MQSELTDFTRELRTDGGQEMQEDPTFNPDEETVTDAWEGAFIYTSWGYGQTNVEMARIIDVSDTGKTVLCRMVQPETVNNEQGSERLRPTADQYGDEFRLHVRNSGGDPAFRGSYPYINGEKDKVTRKDSFLPFSNTADQTVHQTPHGYKH